MGEQGHKEVHPMCNAVDRPNHLIHTRFASHAAERCSKVSVYYVGYAESLTLCTGG